MDFNLNSKNAIGSILGELNEILLKISEDSMERLVQAVLNAQIVFTAGAGRSGLAIKSFAMRLMHLGLHSYVVGETTTPAITDRDLLLIGSGSGSTSSLISHAKKTQTIGTPIALITSQDDSPIAQMAEPILTLPTSTLEEKNDSGFHSTQPLGSLFEQSLQLTLDAIILLIMNQTGKDQDEMFTRHANLE